MSELIDRQAAIDDIWTVSPLAHLDREWIDRWLRQLPPANNSEIPNSSDTISRAKAIEILHEALDRVDQIADVPFGVYQNYRDKMNELPHAQPERIKGHWIEHDDGLTACECSVCHEKYALYEEDVFGRNFCPNCGAEMEVTT